MESNTAEELSNLDSSQLLSKLDEAREAAREAGYGWAQMDKQFKDARELLPSILAEYIQAHLNPGMKLAEAKLRALADKNYQKKVKEMNQFEYIARLKEVEYRGWLKSIEALTAISYVRNSEYKLAR